MIRLVMIVALLSSCTYADPYATSTTPLKDNCISSAIDITVRLHPHVNGVRSAQYSAGIDGVWSWLDGWYDHENRIAHVTIPKSAQDKAAIAVIIHELTHAACGPGHLED